MSLKNTILNYLKSQHDPFTGCPLWIHKGHLGKLAINSWGYENENMGRRCRELENAKQIERKLEKNPRTGIWEALYRFQEAPQREQTKQVDIPLTILGTNIPYNLKQ